VGGLKSDPYQVNWEMLPNHTNRGEAWLKERSELTAEKDI